MPASALPRPARQRRHGTEGHEVACRVIERLGGKGFWQIAPCRARFPVVEARGRLHERIEAAPLRPGTLLAIGVKRDVNDAGAKRRSLSRPEAARRDRAGTIALYEDVGLR